MAPTAPLPLALALAAAAAAATVARAQTPTNPFCALRFARNVVSLDLVCVNGTIDAVEQAFYGAPLGACPSFAPNASCDDTDFSTDARRACVGAARCTLSSAGRADPCPGVVKGIAAVAHCSAPPGGFSPPPPPPSPTCALNGIACPPPQWSPQWNLTRSTVMQPWCSGAAANITHPWGLVSEAWDCSRVGEEAATVARCAQLKAAGLVDRCFKYSNQELALGWLESQAAAMYNPALSGYFLAWPNGTVYNEREGGARGASFGDQYFIDFRNASAAAWYVSSVVASVSEAAIDGSFSDDVTGVPAEHPEVGVHCNLTAAELAELQFATQATNSELIYALIAAGKYDWAAFGNQDGVAPGPPSDAGACGDWMRLYCDPAKQGAPLMMAFSPGAAANQSVAAFLVVRPPTAYLGFGWYSDDSSWDRLFLLDAGEPTALCVEAPANVFSRAWTKGVASLDCNTFEASLPFESLPWP
jgi:hypothetical protein